MDYALVCGQFVMVAGLEDTGSNRLWRNNLLVVEDALVLSASQ